MRRDEKGIWGKGRKEGGEGREDEGSEKNQNEVCVYVSVPQAACNHCVSQTWANKQRNGQNIASPIKY